VSFSTRPHCSVSGLKGNSANKRAPAHGVTLLRVGIFGQHQIIDGADADDLQHLVIDLPEQVSLASKGSAYWPRPTISSHLRNIAHPLSCSSGALASFKSSI
jgi:hypothetical protein